MRFVDLIIKKREQQSLTTEEINQWIDGYTENKIPDYQVSALLMAIVLNGMDQRETRDLTLAMMNSGDTVDLTSIKGIKVDKHSTGGVGDKTTLVLGPMVAACGAKVAKMSGRGLGHTGGTLDKLESITGFNCYLDQETFLQQVNNIGIAVVGQTGSLVPADQKLYALRDVTGTVDSIPLIASSIMSKKLACGSDAILLDVKYGNGAFMKTKEDAKKLAKAMIQIGTDLGRNVKALITDMDLPLGNAIGNALEVREAIATLQGKGPKDLTELCLTAGSQMLVQAQVANSEEEGKNKLKQVIENGQALLKLKEMVAAQGGNVEEIDHLELLPKAKYVTPIYSKQDGYIRTMDALTLGQLTMILGGGRATKTDNIDHSVGIVLNKKTGDYVDKEQILGWIHSNDQLEEKWQEMFYGSFEFQKEEPVIQPLIDSIM